MPNCSLCLEQCDAFVKSHIVPASMVVDPAARGEGIAVISTDNVGRTVTGDFDRFLCEACERSLSACDAHAKRFIDGIETDDRLYASTGELIGRRYTDRFDPGLLRRFGQALLFRAHVTMRAFFNEVDVGPHFGRLRETLNRGEPSDPDDFSVVLLSVGGTLATTIVGPVRVPIDGINSYRFHVPGLSLFVKVDQRHFPNPFHQLSLQDGQPVIALHHDTFHPDTHASLGAVLERHGERVDRVIGQGRRSDLEK